jgi:hypothetical protein
VSVLHCKSGGGADGLAKTPAHSIALDGVAVLLGDGEADARLFIRLLAVKDLEKKGFAATGFPGSYGKKLRPAFQPPDSISLCISRRHALVGQFGR